MPNHKWHKESFKECQKCELKQNEETLFSHLSDISINKIDHYHSIIKKNEYIYRQVDKENHIYTIKSGIVGLSYINDDFKLKTTEILTRSMVAGIEVISNNVYLKDAIALTPVSICQIHLSKKDIEKNHILASNIIKKWQEKYKNQIQISEFTSGKTQNRLIKLFSFLARHSFSHEKNVFYMLSLKHIASIINISTENCSRALSLMKKDSIVEKINQEKFILNELITQ